jgi:RNA polymerase sigma-70 factor (ECF subfamily)
VTGHEWLEARLGAVRPKAIAALNRAFRDLDLAEEVFDAACEKAVRDWPERGLPDDPLAWLLAVARNAALDIVRRRRRQSRIAQEHGPELAGDDPGGAIAEPDPDILRDDVLRLLFVCCHPALSRRDQAALALRVVAGLPIGDVAAGFLVSPAAMEKRLTRAKAAIRDAEIAFEVPGPAERALRLKTVSLMLYLMFNEGWTSAPDAAGPNRILCEEAIRLVRLLLALFPAEPEVQGLLSLLLFHFGRRDGRVGADGRPLTLEEQRRDLWDLTMIAEAQTLLDKALRHAASGPFQVQAAIAGAHAAARAAPDTDWPRIVLLYEELIGLEDTPVVRLNHAAAVARVAGEAAALELMDRLSARLDGYLWFHTTRAGLLEALGRRDEAVAAYERALALDPAPADRTILIEKLEAREFFAH